MAEVTGHRHERIRSLLALRRVDEARQLTIEGLAEDPSDPGLLESLCIGHRLSGETKAAVDAATRLVEAAPEAADSHRLLGVVLHDAGRQKDARAALERALELDPTDPNVRLALVDVLVDLSQAPIRHGGRSAKRMLEEAATHAEEARRLAPAHPAPHIAVGNVALAQGDPAAADAAGSAALELQPDYDVGHQLLGLAAQARGDVRAAGDHFVAAGKLDPTSGHSTELLRRLRGAAPIGGLAMFFVVRGVIVGGREIGGVHILVSILLAVALIVGVGWVLPRMRARRHLSDDAKQALDLDRHLRKRVP